MRNYIAIICFICGGFVLGLSFSGPIKDYVNGIIKPVKTITLDYQGVSKEIDFGKDIETISLVPNGTDGDKMWKVSREGSDTYIPID